MPWSLVSSLFKIQFLFCQHILLPEVISNMYHQRVYLRDYIYTFFKLEVNGNLLMENLKPVFDFKLELLLKFNSLKLCILSHWNILMFKFVCSCDFLN